MRALRLGYMCRLEARTVVKELSWLPGDRGLGSLGLLKAIGGRCVSAVSRRLVFVEVYKYIMQVWPQSV